MELASAFFYLKSWRLENLDQLLVKERNHTYSMLEKLLRFRKSNSYLASVPANLSLMQGQKGA